MNRNRLAKLKQTLAAAPCPRCQQWAAPARPWMPAERAAWDALTDTERAEICALMAQMSDRCAACERVSFDLSKSSDEEKRRALVLLRRVFVTHFGGPASLPHPSVEDTF
ncbi:hypothetical protein [Frigoriglobus tundricola]|uniref:Uncharacterized protein n=1 Tax=Frigoriglobus tundricola TaxID=2774151 RepID=A0A6M5YQU8_9BACT|nr:hypothetical protein [Frigoriglobus tundricola]QJW95621.1 hypothetical protein FTUN_3172 [Frigoriglobus tundricola]